MSRYATVKIGAAIKVGELGSYLHAFIKLIYEDHVNMSYLTSTLLLNYIRGLHSRSFELRER